MIWLNFVIRCLLFQRKFFPVSGSESLNAWIKVYLADNPQSEDLFGIFPYSHIFNNGYLIMFKQLSNSTFSIEMKFEIGYKQYTISKFNQFGDLQVIYNSKENWK